MSDNAKLQSLLGLPALVAEEITFGEFLSRLKTKPEIAETAASLLVRAIESMGEVKIDEAPEARRPYLRMLKQFGIPTWQAFDKVRGSQRTVYKILNFLRAGAANGYQLRQALILRSGPGAGKGFLIDHFKDALEGTVVYAVKGCPVHENPINLLTLLPAKTVKEIGKDLGISKTLDDLLAVAGRPCQDCWQSIMEGQDKDKPNLFQVPVQAVRVSSRKFGISTWMAGQGCSLHSSLEHGSRGIVDMPEMFAIPEPAPGEASELDVLLDATNDRRLLNRNKCGNSEATGYLPFDGVIIGQTNPGAYQAFIDKQKDPVKYLRRFFVFDVPYNMSVTEEELAYRDFIGQMKELPHIDPMALKLTALLGVISRMKPDHEVDIVSRARMYDGETLPIPRKSSSSSSSPYSSGFGGTWQSSSSTPARRIELENWTVLDLWRDAGEDEGQFGLNMADMLATVSSAIELSLKDKRKFLSTLRMIQFLRGKVAELKKKPGLSKRELDVLNKCEEYLKPQISKTDSPGVIEAEFRRVLRRELMQVVAPDFDSRAQELGRRYREHARQYSMGAKRFRDKSLGREVDVDTDFLNLVDRWMKLTAVDERDQFRRSYEAELLAISRDNFRKQETGDEAAAVDIDNWRAVPRLAQGIISMLNDDISKNVERILRPEHELSEEELKLRKESLTRFRALGYSEHSLEEALQYIKAYELWKVS